MTDVIHVYYIHVSIHVYYNHPTYIHVYFIHYYFLCSCLCLILNIFFHVFLFIFYIFFIFSLRLFLWRPSPAHLPAHRAWGNDQLGGCRILPGRPHGGPRAGATWGTAQPQPPPLPDETTKVDSMVKTSGLPVRVAWQSGKNLADKLTRSALEKVPCPAGNKKFNCCLSGLEGRCHKKKHYDNV